MRYLLLCLLLWVVGRAAAQSDEDSAFSVRIDAGSVVVRALPSFDAEVIASVFLNERLIAEGRNLDGKWFLVRRMGRMSTLGWVSTSVLRYEFPPEQLPLVDFTTGATGEFVLTSAPVFAGYTLAEVNLRTQPSDAGAVIRRAPLGVVLPILERDQIGTWFYVNYFGVGGWVNGDNLRGVENYEPIPIASGLPDIPFALALVIPLETQLSEIQEFRDYLNAQNSFANEVVVFWSNVLGYEAMPCEPPPFVLNYLYNNTDERAFPELYYLVPRLETATSALNDAITPMYTCGVKRSQIVLDARNAAINATIIYRSTLNALDNIEATITRYR